MHILFVDKITVLSLLKVLAAKHGVMEVWYFEDINAPLQRLIRLFVRLGLIRAEVRQVEYHVGQILNGGGQSPAIELHNDARDICSKIKTDILSKMPLVKRMESIWSPEKVILFFEKMIEPEVRLECLRIGLVDWIMRTRLGMPNSQCSLLIGHKQWLPYVKAYARQREIRLLSYGMYIWKLSYVERISFRAIKALLGNLPVLWKSGVKHLFNAIGCSCSTNFSEKRLTGIRGTASGVAIRYWHRKLSFDQRERNEFFWLNKTEIPYSEVLLYDYVGNRALGSEVWNNLKERGVRLMGHGPRIPVWRPTRLMFGVLIRILFRIAGNVIYCLRRGHRISFFFLRGLLALAVDYSYWYDFYAKNKVRVNVGSDNTRIGQVLALDCLNGISVEYQMSLGNICWPKTDFCAGEDVEFVFSPVFEFLWRTVEVPVRRYVHTGYIYDAATSSVNTYNRISETRKQLHDNGVQFIVCFFDENSRDTWDVPDSHKRAIFDYEFLIKWLINDPSLGIVFKPKDSSKLFHRIASISRLIDQGLQTGRCKFLTSSHLIGSIYPAEVALMSDISIGRLNGGTAAFEARLAGVRTLLIDRRRLHSHPFYSGGLNRVIYDDWESLRVAVEEFRGNPDRCPEFGEWSPELDDLDPFQDGQASLRMGLYIQWLYEALKQGESKQSALSFASRKFTQRWGDGHITLNECANSWTIADQCFSNYSNSKLTAS